jgi:predicted dehydrogenase
MKGFLLMSQEQSNNNQKNHNISRRNFLSVTAGTAAAAFTIVPRNVLGGPGFTPPSDMVNVAGIGIGSRGGQDIQQICDPDVPIERNRPSGGSTRRRSSGQGGQQTGQRPPQRQQEEREPTKLANIYALCDVDTDFAGRIFKGYPKAKVYQDFRKMLDKEKGIDAVVIGTPDHSHAVIASWAMKMKKHVYVEKPMAKTIYECRKLAEIAKEMNVVTQMGNQGHASDDARLINEWIADGALGDVREVHCWTNRPIWPQGDLERPEEIPSVPSTLDWNVWLGPAPFKPYHPSVCHFNWRGLQDYGTGALGDMGAHIFDHPFWALNLGYPNKVQACSTRYSEDYWPLAEIITYEFPARGKMPPVKLTWFDGGLTPPRPAELEPGRRITSSGVFYYGDKNVLTHTDYGRSPRIIPETRMKEYKLPPKTLPRSPGIYEEWIDAIKNNTKSSTDFSYSSRLVETMMLGNIAVLMKDQNKILEYNGENMKFTNVPEANDLLHYEYRIGWSI